MVTLVVLDSMRWFFLALGACLVGCGGDDDPASGSGTESGTSSAEAGTGSTGQAEPDAASCEVIDPVTDATPGSMPDPTRRRSIMGANGTFTDECDGAGNLLEYVCEVVLECGPGPNPACPQRQTGEVVPAMFDCAGTCMNGTCVGRCPDHGDEVEYLEVTGVDVVFENHTDARRYDCVMSFDQTNEPYDCTNDPAVGDVTTVYGLGLMSVWCTGTQSFNIGTSIDATEQQCSYMCTMLPE